MHWANIWIKHLAGAIINMHTKTQRKHIPFCVHLSAVLCTLTMSVWTLDPSFRAPACRCCQALGHGKVCP